MSHVFFLAAINILFGVALYSKDQTLRKSLFGASGLVALSYGLLTLTFGLNWLFVTFSCLFVAVEAGRRARHIRGENPNREWTELQFMLLFIVIVTLYVSNLSAIVLESIILSIATILVISVNLLMRRHIVRHLFQPVEPLEDYPTVSLLIPARNEDHALEETLNQALISEYPKLEILVLDDSSQDSTPDIIRSFAHKGVRFIEGQPLTNDWLGKNYALEQLRISANGEILLFADTDVQFQPYAITELVNYMQQKKYSAVSVLPATRGFDMLPMFIRPLYNFLITLAPFGALKTARAYGTCFAITDNIAQNYSFEQAKNVIFPERHLATKLKAANRYHSVIGDFALGITIRKRISSQLKSQQRNLYPMLGNSTPLVALYSLGLLTMVVLPVISLTFPFNLLIYAGYTVAYIQYLGVHSPQSVLLAPFQLLILVILEAFTAVYSLVVYSFSELAWKNRRVCVVPDSNAVTTKM